MRVESVGQERAMSASARLSSRYRITIPKEVGERFGLKPGQRVVLTPRGRSLHLESEAPSAFQRGIANEVPEDQRERGDQS